MIHAQGLEIFHKDTLQFFACTRCQDLAHPHLQEIFLSFAEGFLTLYRFQLLPHPMSALHIVLICTCRKMSTR